jgi:hypothetical protein
MPHIHIPSLRNEPANQPLESAIIQDNLSGLGIKALAVLHCVLLVKKPEREYLGNEYVNYTEQVAAAMLVSPKKSGIAAARIKAMVQ